MMRELHRLNPDLVAFGRLPDSSPRRRVLLTSHPGDGRSSETAHRQKPSLVHRWVHVRHRTPLPGSRNVHREPCARKSPLWQDIMSGRPAVAGRILLREPCWTPSNYQGVNSAQGAKGQNTYSPACQLPSPRMASACTLVMRKRFSVSARLAESCASCDWSWAWKSKRDIRDSVADTRKSKRTSCLALTAPPDEAIDCRDAVFVLKLRDAMARE